MTNELEKILIPLIEKAAAGAENAADFVIEQAPEVVEQLLRWKLWQSLVIFVGLIGLFVLLIVGAIKWWKREGGYTDEQPIIIALCGGASMVLFLLGVTAPTLDWLMILVAPKLYLIEYAARLAKGG
jgi:hypothetical protein